jgi:hypothetical protein
MPVEVDKMKAYWLSDSLKKTQSCYRRFCDVAGSAKCKWDGLKFVRR